MSPTSDPVQVQIAENRRRVLLLLGAFAAVVFLVVFVVLAVLLGLLLGLGGFLLAVLVGAAAAAGATWSFTTNADRTVLGRIGASPVDERTQPRLHNLVEGLCVAAGVSKPDLYVVDDPAPNASSIGRDPRRAALVVTTGLLEKLTRIELEGVIAHELSHVKGHDTAASTLAVALLGRVVPTLVPRAVGRDRESAADVTGVSLTRYPPGLISALEKLRDDPLVLRTADRAVAHLWIEAPLAEPPPRPPLDERIQALREL
jgi:heat shock protein HtpX